METAVGSFAIAGATLAQIMHDFGSVEGDCDGILFGRLQHRTTSSMQDDEAGPAITHEQITARVTGYYCSGRVQSFYDSTGRINQSKLSNIVRERQGRGEDPPIGWYLGRRNSILWPSMREAAVTSYLRSGVITSSMAEENSANLISPSELKGLQIGSVQVGEPSSTSPSGTRKNSSVFTNDSINQTGRVGGLGAAAKSSLHSVPVLDSPVSPTLSTSPSKRSSSSSSSSPRQEKRIEPTGISKAPLPPCFFVLFTESYSANNAVRTHEYRAFQSLHNPKGFSFEPLPVNIVNAGVSFRGFYDSFVPVASIPSSFNAELNSETSVESPSNVRGRGGRSSSAKPTALLENSSGAYQDASDASLGSLAGEESVKAGEGFRVTQFESMYQQMLTRLERLSTEAYDSSVALHQVSRST